MTTIPHADWRDDSSAAKRLYLLAGANGRGHPVPDGDVRRRYVRSKRNFLEVYAPLADRWTLFFNGAAQLDMVARKDAGGRATVFSESLYRLFTEEP